MVSVGLSGLAKQGCKLCPGIGSVHVDHANRFDARLRRFAIEQHWGFARLDRPPESFFGGNKDRLIDRVGLDRQFNPLAAAVDNGEHGLLGARDQHVVLKLSHMLLSGRLLRERPRQHKLRLEDGAGFLDQSIQRGGHPWDCPVDRMALDVTDPVARV